MDKIKRIVTILAIVGTIGVTAVFLYYPIREFKREWLKNEVSLADAEAREGEYITAVQGYGAGSIVQENEMGSGVQGERAGVDEQESGPGVFQNRGVRLALELDGISCEVDLWRDEVAEGEDMGYFFLPAAVKQEECEIRIEDFTAGDFIRIGGKELKKGDVLRDIGWENQYLLEAYGKDGDLLGDIRVMFVCAENLPAVFWDTESGSLDLIRADANNTEGGEVRIFDEEGRVIYQGQLERAGGRGNSTWALDKKPFEIKLKQSADLFGFGAAESWNLMANGYDETQYRNMLAMWMGEEAGLAYTPQGRMVSLYCNGEYQGNYYLSEKVRIGEGRVEIRDLGAETLAVHQNSEPDKMKLMTSQDGRLRWIDTGYDPVDISGGYIVERELPERYLVDTDCGFQTEQGDCYTIVAPEHASLAQVSYIANLVQEMQDAVEADTGVNSRTGKHYTDYIDMDSFVKKYLVEEISKNYDGGTTSSFYYKPADRESTKLFAGPLWDFDVAFGNSEHDEINSDPVGVTMLADHIYGTELFRELYQKPEFKAAAAEYYREEFSGMLEEILTVKIDEYDRIYGRSIACNNIRWRGMENRHNYYETYEENLRYLRSFIERRKEYLDKVWISDEEYHQLSFYVDGLIWKRMYVKDGSLPGAAPLPRRNSSLFLRFSIRPDGGMSFDENRPIYGDMDFYAQWEEL